MTAYLTQTSDDVLRLYEKLDQKIEEFKAVSNLRCPSGCGRCCENPNIFCSVLEVLPLAGQLWQNKSATRILSKIGESGCGVCVFYEPNPLKSGNGRCSVYPWRPLICRLFGYAAKQDKYLKSQLVTCPTMKSYCAKEYQQVVENLDQGKIISPLMREYTMQLLTIEPHLGIEQFSINTAVRIAIEKIGLLNAQ